MSGNNVSFLSLTVIASAHCYHQLSNYVPQRSRVNIISSTLWYCTMHKRTNNFPYSLQVLLCLHKGSVANINPVVLKNTGAPASDPIGHLLVHVYGSGKYNSLPFKSWRLMRAVWSWNDIKGAVRHIYTKRAWQAESFSTMLLNKRRMQIKAAAAILMNLLCSELVGTITLYLWTQNTEWERKIRMR